MQALTCRGGGRPSPHSSEDDALSSEATIRSKVLWSHFRLRRLKNEVQNRVPNPSSIDGSTPDFWDGCLFASIFDAPHPLQTSTRTQCKPSLAPLAICVECGLAAPTTFPDLLGPIALQFRSRPVRRVPVTQLFFCAFERRCTQATRATGREAGLWGSARSKEERRAKHALFNFREPNIAPISTLTMLAATLFSVLSAGTYLTTLARSLSTAMRRRFAPPSCSC